MTIPLTRPLVLASNPPRRRQLLQETVFECTPELRPTPDEFPLTLPADDVPAFLARQKAECFGHDHDNRLILCADTIVVQGTPVSYTHLSRAPKACKNKNCPLSTVNCPLTTWNR